MESIKSALPFRAVAFDLDDTMLRDDLTISDFSLNVLRRLAEQGVAIVPASGRAQMSMQPFVDQIGDVALFICCNGAEIRDGKTSELLHTELFPAELGREIAVFGKRHHCYAQTYAGPHFYYNEESEWARRYAKASMLTGVLVGDLEAFIQEPRNKVLMMDAPEKIAEMLREAQDLFRGRASVTCSKPWFLEFNPPGATKGLALEWSAARLGISPKEFIAFGDSLNDLSMLQAAGRGVLMRNGREDLRSLCDDICGTNQEDGVAAYLADCFGEVFA